MSNTASTPRKKAVLHWLSHIPRKRTACGSPSGYTTWQQHEVTCQRCLKIMRKYDIESI